jgi:hypothetical protein
VRSLLSCTWFACVVARERLHAGVVPFQVQHGLRAGERVCAAGLTRAAIVKARAPVGRRLRFGCAGLFRAWHSATGAQAWWPMPPSNRQHRLHQAHLGAPGWLALATAAAYNRSINTDAQGRPPLRGSHSLVAGYLQR